MPVQAMRGGFRTGCRCILTLILAAVCPCLLSLLAGCLGWFSFLLLPYLPLYFSTPCLTYLSVLLR